MSSCASRTVRTAAAATNLGVRVGEGSAAVVVGGGAPIVVQSMTNTDTADVEATARQVAALARAGSELVRITVDRDEAAAAVPHIRDRLAAMGVDGAADRRFPLHRPQASRRSSRPAPRRSTSTASIPAMSASRTSATFSSASIVEIAIRNGKAVRIGANWGSLDQELLTHLMDENALKPRAARGARGDARGDGPLGAVGRGRAEEIGLHRSRIILSAKVSAVQDLIAVYRMLGRALGLRAASRPHRGGHGLEGHRRLRRRLSACSCRRGSATRSAFR